MRKLEITMLTPAHDTGFSNLKDQLDAALDNLIDQHNTEDPGMLTAGGLTQSAHGYEWEDWEGNQYWEGNESYLGYWKDSSISYYFHASNEVKTYSGNQTTDSMYINLYTSLYRRDLIVYHKFQLEGDGDYSMEGFREYTDQGTQRFPFSLVEPLHFQFVGNSDNNTFTMYYGQNTVYMGAGGNNIADIRGGLGTVIAGAGDDTISISNDWNNPGHPGNWSSSKVDLSAGGKNVVEVSGNTSTSGLTIAAIILGSGEDTVIARKASHVIIQGAESTGNHTIELNGTQGGKGTVYTGRGETNLTALQGDYDIHLGDGINVVDLSNWTGTNITVTFGSGIDTVFGHQHGMELDLTGSNGGATLHLGAGQDQILIDDPSVSAPSLIYDFDFEQDIVTFGNDEDMWDLLEAGILLFETLQEQNGYQVTSLYNPEGYVLAQSDGTELFVDAGTVWSTFIIF